MTIRNETYQVNVCTAPAFMGHEELVLPMLVLGSSARGKSHKLGGFWHCLNETFQPNDLSNTAVVGYTAGQELQGLNLASMFVGRDGDEWKQFPEIGHALDAMGKAYAFFLETSAAPLHDGFIKRCRFVNRDRFPDFHPKLNTLTETEQDRNAQAALTGFLREQCAEADYRAIYGDYFHSRDIRDRFGDDEQFGFGYAIWLEKEGVLRAWTRTTYVPK